MVISALFDKSINLRPERLGLMGEEAHLEQNGGNSQQNYQDSLVYFAWSDWAQLTNDSKVTNSVGE